ncbi:hypothetical protein MK489_18455 [Myxococcota bacterium]|nr:hypothetical protein [Myxococcota bacterium]
MEDRTHAGLYLEMTDETPEVYAESRLREVLGWPGVERGTWWRNLVPGRTEFPRTLPEFATLAVYEVGETFAPMSPGAERSLTFRRTPRPGQGNLSGQPTLGLELVLISPRNPGGAQALRDWADFIHIREIAASSAPGFTMITPYENAGEGEPRFMHFYEMDTADAEKAFQGMAPATQVRVGAPGSPEYDEWANHPELRINYVNTFTRIGEAIA